MAAGDLCPAAWKDFTSLGTSARAIFPAPKAPIIVFLDKAGRGHDCAGSGLSGPLIRRIEADEQARREMLRATFGQEELDRLYPLCAVSVVGSAPRLFVVDLPEAPEAMGQAICRDALVTLSLFLMRELADGTP